MVGLRVYRDKVITISSKYEVVGLPVSIFSKTCIIIALVLIGNLYYGEAFLRNAQTMYTILGTVLLLATIFALLFVRRRSV